MNEKIQICDFLRLPSSAFFPIRFRSVHARKATEVEFQFFFDKSHFFPQENGKYLVGQL
jgi:hypothetical protein